MNIDIPENAKVADILKTVQGLGEGGHIYCGSERHFSLLKICLIKLQKSDVNVYLLDEHGFTLKQVSAKKKRTAIDPVLPDPVIAPVIAAVAELVTEPVAAPVTAPETVLVAAQEGASTPSDLSPSQPDASAPVAQQELGLSHPQISAVRDLEQAFRRCRELGLLLIGFSDGLVAVPEALGYGADAISSADALEVESFDAYRGYEADEEAG